MSGNDGSANSEGDLTELRGIIDSQSAEIEKLKADLKAETDRVSRRGLIRGLGLTGLVALGAAGGLGGAEAVLATPDGVTDNSDLAGVLPAFLQMTSNGDSVEGDATSPGWEGSIEVLYFKQSVSSLKDASSGLATTRRQYNPIVFRKRIDKSTPLLAKALINNEGIEATFFFLRPTSGGTTEQFFTVQISNGRVAAIENYLPETFQTGGEALTQPLQQVSVTFNQITWTYVDGGVEFTDSALSRV
jgi:type VI secretion system secreted protein Hcp